MGVFVSWQDCADAGWWMGEIGGRQGVFPDNFVKVLLPEVEKEVSHLFVPCTGFIQCTFFLSRKRQQCD